MLNGQRLENCRSLKQIVFILSVIHYSCGYSEVILKLDNLDPGVPCGTAVSVNNTDQHVTTLLIDELHKDSLNYEEACQCFLAIFSHLELESNASTKVTIEELQEQINDTSGNTNATEFTPTTFTEPHSKTNYTEHFYTMSAEVVEILQNFSTNPARFLVSEVLQNDYRIPVLLSFDQPVFINFTTNCLSTSTQESTTRSSKHASLTEVQNPSLSINSTTSTELHTYTPLFDTTESTVQIPMTEHKHTQSTNNNSSKSTEYIPTTHLQNYTHSTGEMTASNLYPNQSEPAGRTTQPFTITTANTQHYRYTTIQSDVMTDQEEKYSTFNIFGKSSTTKSSILFSSTTVINTKETGMSDDDETLLIAIIVAIVGMFLLGTCMVYVLIRKRKKVKKWRGRTESMYGIEGVINAYDETATYQNIQQDYVNDNNNDLSYKVPEVRVNDVTMDLTTNSLNNPIVYGKQVRDTYPEVKNNSPKRPNQLNLLVPTLNFSPDIELNGKDRDIKNQYILDNTEYNSENQFLSNSINNKPNNHNKKTSPNLDLKQRFLDMKSLPEISEKKEPTKSSHYASTEILKMPLHINTNAEDNGSNNVTAELNNRGSAPSLPPKNPKVLFRSNSAIQKSDLSPIYIGDVTYPRPRANTSTGSEAYPHYANISNLHHPKVSALYNESQPTAFADINISDVNRKGKRSKRPHSFSNDYSHTAVDAIPMNPYHAEKLPKVKGSSSTYERPTGSKHGDGNKMSKLQGSNSLRIPKLSSEEVAELYALPVKAKRNAAVTEKKTKSFNIGSLDRSNNANQRSLKKNPYFFEVI